MFTRVRGAHVSFRDVTIKIPDRRYDQGCEWRHAPEAWAEIWEMSVCWVLPWKKTVDFRLLAEAWWQVSHVVWGRWKSHYRKIVSLSYVEKPFNSKVIKSFVPELTSRKCFCVLGFLCYIYVRYGHYERFAYWYKYVHFTYSCMAMLHILLQEHRLRKE